MPELPLSTSGETAAAVARACAQEAGRIAMDAFGRRQDVLVKGRGNFLTETDLAAERAVLAILRKEYPEHELLAEESAAEPKGEGWMWVVDPLDGTHNFSRGIPYFAFNIALCYGREPLLGLTYAPATGEEFFAEDGKGLTVNGQPVRASTVERLSDCVLGVDLGYEDARAARLLELGDTLGQTLHYLRLLLEVLPANGWFLLIPLLLLVVRRWRPDRLPAEPREARDATALLGIHIAVSVLLLALLSPRVYLRYLAPLLPPLFLLLGHWLARLSRLQPALAAAVVVAFVAFGSLQDFVGELRHDYDGPIEGIVDFLNRHADPDDTVGIVYGDLPLKFYTDLRVVGGLTGEDVEAEGPADWILLRYHTVAPVSRAVRRSLRRQLTEGVYRPH
ncbi:MAG: hypothetical protein IH920_04895, partial [Chloroflexi bacterium]|nr:hypothetical protein [Chloroflexota bacterium]